MSVYKKGTITVECGPGMKNVFYQRVPFTNGLQINFDDEDDIIQIQYELDNQDIETLVNFLNKQDKKDFRLTCHSQDDQHKEKDYDLARDISKILAADDDGDDIIPTGKREGPGQNVGSIGKPLDDSKKNLQGALNSKGLKSKSSSFYPPNDPRSSNQDEQGARGPIGGYPGQKQVGGAGMGMFYPGSTMKVNVDDFDQIFQDEDDSINYPQPRQMQGGMQGNMMMNPSMPRSGNPNMNPNFNPNMGAPGGMGVGPGPVGPTPGQMYPGQNMQGNAGRFKGGPMAAGGMGMNPNFQGPQKGPGAQRMHAGGMQPMQNQDPNFYGAGFDDVQPPMATGKNPKSGRGGKAAAQRGGYADYGNYAEDEGYGNMDYGRGNPGAMTGGYQKPGRAPNPQHAAYDQYQGDEYGDPSVGYNDQMGGNMRNQGGIGPGVRGGMGAMAGRGGQMGGRYPAGTGGEYYEEDYDDPMNAMGGQMGGPRGGAHAGMGYDQEYDEYGDPIQAGYGANQGGYHNDYQQPQYGSIPPQQPAAGGMAPQQGIGGMGAIVQEPFTVEGSINSQTFDRKPGFDRSRKKVHTRERLRANLQKNKQADQKIPKKKSDAKGNGEDGDRNDKQGGNQDGAKEPRRENIDSDMDDGENNSKAFLEEEISSESNPRPNSQGSLEDNDDDGSHDGKKD